MTEAKLINHNGSPAIKIGDKFFPPMTATVTTCKARYGEYGRILDKDYFKALGDAGIKIYYVMCNNLGLDDKAIEDFSTEAEALFEAVPDAYIMVRFCLHPSEEWCENNPDEMVQYTDGREIPTLLTAESYHVHLKGMHSLCSKKWREDMGELMVETIKKLKALPYGDRIVGEGYMPAQLCPMIYADDENCTVLAHFLSNDKPAVAYKQNDGYNAIYYGAKYITADVVREFARYAGCHIYEETGHVLHVNKNFLTLHATHSGEVNIKLPKKCSPYELYEEKSYGENTDILTFNIKKGQTKMFYLK